MFSSQVLESSNIILSKQSNIMSCTLCQIRHALTSFRTLPSPFPRSCIRPCDMGWSPSNIEEYSLSDKRPNPFYPCLAGFFFDSTGSYEVTFYVAGSAIVAAGLICLPLRFLWHCEGARSAIEQYEKERSLEGDQEIRQQVEIGKDILYLPIRKCDSDTSKLPT